MQKLQELVYTNRCEREYKGEMNRISKSRKESYFRAYRGVQMRVPQNLPA